METETSALLQNKNPSSNSQDRTPLQSSGKHASPLPLVRCYVFCGLLTFIGSLTFSTTPAIINQYVHSRLLDDYNVSWTSEGNSACLLNATNTSRDATLTLAQEETSSFMVLLAVTNNVPAIFMNVILGSSSDFLGRRMLFFVPFFGSLLNNIFSVCIMHYEMDINYFYLASILDGLGGSLCAFLVACFAYTADITFTGRSRIIAVSAVELGAALAAAVGQLLTGYLIAIVGYVYLRIMMASVVLCGCLLALVLPETTKRRPMQDCSPLAHFKNSFRYYYSTNDKKILYNLVLAIFLCMVVSTLGRAGIETLYGLGEPFCFDSIQVGYFGALRITLANIGSISAIKLLQRCLHYEVIALIGSIDSVISLLLQGLATSGTILFLVPVVGLISSTAISIARGTMSRITSSREQGAMFSGIAVFETSVYMLSQVLFNWVYSSTVAHVKGAAFFLLAAFSLLGSLLIIIWIRISPKYRDQYTIHVSKEENVSISKST